MMWFGEKGTALFFIFLNKKSPGGKTRRGLTFSGHHALIKDQVTILRGTKDMCLNSFLYSDSPIFLILAEPSL